MAKTLATLATLTPLAVLLLVSSAHAERIQNKVAVFAALDKVTARISKLEVPLGQTVEFGSLKVTPRTCLSSPPTDLPKTTTFVEVDEQELEGAQKRIFTGWMFAESPALNAVEHPVFDIWLTGCKEPTSAPQAALGEPEDRRGIEGSEEPSQPFSRRRVRR
ncbi:MAG: DUF2155 domain-containing protein [Hyphomicrobiaceae bacterium]